MASSFWKNFMIAGRDLNNLKAAWKNEDRTQLQQVDQLMKQAKRDKDEELLNQARAIIEQNRATREEEEYQYKLKQRPLQERKQQAEVKKAEKEASTAGTDNKLSKSAELWTTGVNNGSLQGKNAPQSIRDEIMNKEGWDIYEIQAQEEFVPQFRTQNIGGRSITQVQRKRGGQWEDVDMTKQMPGGMPSSDLVPSGNFPPPIVVPSGSGTPSAPSGGQRISSPKPKVAPGKGMQWVYEWVEESGTDKYGNTTSNYRQKWYQAAIPKPAKKDKPPVDKKKQEYNSLKSEFRKIQAGKQYNVDDFSQGLRSFLRRFADKKGRFTLTGPQRGQVWRQLYSWGTGKTIAEPAEKPKKYGSDLTF